MDLQLTVESPRPGVTLIRADGMVNMQSVELWEKRVQEEARKLPKALLIECSKIASITSWGMGVLFACSGVLDKKDTHLILIAPQGEVFESMRVIGLLELVPVAANLEQALELVESGKA
ncbi:MAG: STAS domain-containing protein [Planctomycetota bacterium]|nr:STAS domain-containing protein [Planctomycetota bacterium]